MGDPEKQWEWHETHRDFAKNMYRTSYTDMSHGREVCVKSDYPSGYGGHVPSLRFDVFHRNTQFDRSIALRRNDPSRDSHPSFQDQREGIPMATAFPQGSRGNNPTLGVVPHDGTTTMLKPPFGVLLARRPLLNYRNPPPSMARTASSPALVGSGSMVMGSPAKSSVMKSPVNASRIDPTLSRASEMGDDSWMPNESEILRDQLGPM